MSIIRIEQIYLYTDQVFEIKTALDEAGNTIYEQPVVDDTTDSAKAIQWLKDNNITDYVNLNYQDATTHDDCFRPLNTWLFENKTQEISAFPFLYYTEVHDDLPVNHMPIVLLYGLDEIVNSNLVELYQLGK